MAKKLPYYDNNKRIIPMVKTEYLLRGKKWVPIKEEREYISRNQTKNVLSKQGIPCERSHRLECRDKYKHNETYDTFSSISPDGQKKVTYYVDFNQGQKNYERLAHKHWYDKQRYKQRKGKV